MKTKLVAVVALPLVLTLSACGDTWGERAVTGGGIGAGTGLVIGAWPVGRCWRRCLSARPWAPASAPPRRNNK